MARRSLTEDDPFGVAVGILSRCCAKAQFPDLEAAIEILSPQIGAHWVLVVDEAIARAERELELGRTTDEVVAILMSLVLTRLRTGMPPLVQSSIQNTIEMVFDEAGLEFGTAGLMATAARVDLETSLREKVIENETKLRRALGLSQARLRQARLGELLGRNARTWVPAVVDLWVFRWLNLATFDADRRTATAWQAIAKIDLRTTKFCRWVNKRIVAVEKLERQFDELVAASSASVIAARAVEWPLLLNPSKGSEADWLKFFNRTDVGFPPYHWRCRTIVRPIRSKN